MSEGLSWSPGSLAALRRLHSCDWLLFVEGDGDVAFWRAVLDHCGVTSFKIKVVGNDRVLARYAAAVAGGGVESVVVAGDRDYRPWIRDSFDHDRVVYTFGYSSENTLYAPSFVTRVLEDLAGTQGLDEADFAEWIEGFCQDCEELVMLDIADQLAESGIGPLGHNASRFLTGALNTRNSELERVCEGARLSIPKPARDEARKLLDGDERSLSLVVRGHFLTHAVLRYVCRRYQAETSKKCSLSKRSLRAMLVGRLAGAWSNRADLADLERRIGIAFTQ